MAMSEKERKQLQGFLIALALGAPIAFWIYWRAPLVTQAQALQNTIDSLHQVAEASKEVLRTGTIEDLRARIAEHERYLEVMRELVPEQHEVTSLINDVSTQADLRGVAVTEIQRFDPEDIGAFREQRYQFTVVGQYDQIGEFLSDVASLRRVMVPYNLSLQVADEVAIQGLGLAPGRTHLSATFELKTFVKAPAAIEGNGESS